MGLPLLLEYYNELPEPMGANANEWEEILRAALEKFKKNVKARVLGRNPAPSCRLNRRAKSPGRDSGPWHDRFDEGFERLRGRPLARRRRQRPSTGVRRPVVRVVSADNDDNNAELQKIMDVRDHRKRRVRLEALISRAPLFAEAINQRAILHFENEDWALAISDCEKVLKLNPFHFGAAAGLGRCFMQLRKHRAALKAFRTALHVNPGLVDVEEAVRTLESTLGEEGRRDDKK